MNSIDLDKISIEELNLFARVGCTAEERSFPQRLVADIEIALDLATPAKTGNLQDTICYLSLKDAAVAFLSQTEWKLLEQLTSDLSSFILESYPSVQMVTLIIKKFVCPDAKAVSVQMTRSR